METSLLLPLLLVWISAVAVVTAVFFFLHWFLHIGRPWEPRFTFRLGDTTLKLMKKIGLCLVVGGLVGAMILALYWLVPIALGLFGLGVFLYASADIELQTRKARGSNEDPE